MKVKWTQNALLPLLAGMMALVLLVFVFAGVVHEPQGPPLPSFEDLAGPEPVSPKPDSLSVLQLLAAHEQARALEGIEYELSLQNEFRRKAMLEPQWQQWWQQGRQRENEIVANLFDYQRQQSLRQQQRQVELDRLNLMNAISSMQADLSEINQRQKMEAFWP